MRGNPILALLRRVLFLPRAKIDIHQAMVIAHREAISRGFPWSAPFAIEQLKTWCVLPSGRLFNSPRILVDNQDGRVLSVKTLPR